MCNIETLGLLLHKKRRKVKSGILFPKKNSNLSSPFLENEIFADKKL